MRTTFLLLAVTLAGCDRRTSTVGGGGPAPDVMEPDTRPAFVLDASKPFVVEFGRGSGLYATLTWNPLSKQQGLDEQAALWARLQPGR